MNDLELRALIVDDEAPAREVLQRLLWSHSNVKVVGEATSVATALALCADLRPNLIFLDVQMKDGTGFSMLEKLESVPAIIFVSAYDQHAIRAFEVNAVDYLLKPVNSARLTHALQRIIRDPQQTPTKVYTEKDQIFLRSDSKKFRAAFIMEIGGIMAEGNYSLVHLIEGSTTLIRRRMAEWERILPKQCFLRLHRSFIVNLHAIKKVLMSDCDEIDVEVAGFSESVHLNRRAAGRLRRALRQPNLL